MTPDARTRRHLALAEGLTTFTGNAPIHSATRHPVGKPGPVLSLFRIVAPHSAPSKRAIEVHITNSNVRVTFEGATTFIQEWASDDESMPDAEQVTSALLREIRTNIYEIQADKIVKLRLHVSSGEKYGGADISISIFPDQVQAEVKRHSNGREPWETPHAEVISWSGRLDATY